MSSSVGLCEQLFRTTPQEQKSSFIVSVVPRPQFTFVQTAVEVAATLSQLAFAGVNITGFMELQLPRCCSSAHAGNAPPSPSSSSSPSTRQGRRKEPLQLIKLLTNNTTRTRRVLRQSGVRFEEQRVLVTAVNGDIPGQIARISCLLLRANVRVLAAYLTTAAATLAFEVSDPRSALRALEDHHQGDGNGEAQFVAADAASQHRSSSSSSSSSSSRRSGRPKRRRRVSSSSSSGSSSSST